jgi:hypothetical protein
MSKKKINRKKVIIIVAAVSVIILTLLYLYFTNINKFITSNTTSQGSSSNTGLRPGAQDTQSTKDGAAVNAPATNDTKIEKGGVVINEPAAGTAIQPGTTVISGKVTSSVGGDLYYMVKGASAGVLVDTKVQTIAPSSVNEPYSFTLSFDNFPKGSDQAVLEVYLMNGTERLGYADIGVKI